MLEATIYSIKLFVCLISEDFFWEMFLVLCEVSLKYLVWFLEHSIAVIIDVPKLCEWYVIKISFNLQAALGTKLQMCSQETKQ